MSDSLREIAERADRALSDLEGLTADLDETRRAQMVRDGLDPNTGRRPSKAAAILGENTAAGPATDQFFLAVQMARSTDYDEQAAGKALLNQMGSRWGEPQKAVLGDTNAAGGYLVPRNVVAELAEVSVSVSPIRNLFTVVDGVKTAAAVDIPLEGPAPMRAVIVSRGATKENQDFTVGNYTATFYTLARITDAGNQWLRQTGGAGEKLVRSRLGRAFALGEAYYVLSGSGSGEPMGLLTSLAAGPASMTTGHTASDSTVAGSVRAAIVKAIEALAARGRVADGVLLNPGDAAHASLQGADAAGFWTDGTLGDIGLPDVKVYTSTAMTSKTAVVGEWKSAQFYVGENYRVDTSSEAGDRFDKNLTGFRAEEDVAFNADPYVAAGMFQRITGLIP